MDKSDNKIYIPLHKLGIKILSDDQLQSNLPTYNGLMQKIETHRKNTYQFYFQQRGEFSSDISYNLMNDNVLSIIGVRGSGKTSCLYTIRNKLQRRYNGIDLHLPVIVPEMIDPSSYLLGYIINALEDIVNEIDVELKDISRQKKSDPFYSNCLHDSVQESKLKNAYKEFAQAYFAGLRGDSPSIYTENPFTAVKIMFENQKMLYGLQKKAHLFWNQLIEAKSLINQKILKNSNQSLNMPLVFIMIDDVDLSPDRSEEMLMTVLRYLSHPNVVVVITADYTLLLEGIKYKLTGRLMGNLVNGIRPTTRAIPQVVHDLGPEYLNKLIPPSTSYYISTYNTNQKKAAFYLSLRNSKDGNPITVKLETFLSQCLDDYFKGASEILTYKIGNIDVFLEGYLLFFGETSREITNICFAIEELLMSLKKLKDHSLNVNIEQIYALCVNFIRLVFDTNHLINSKIDVIAKPNPEDYIKINYSESLLYIDFQTALFDYLEQCQRDKNKSWVLRRSGIVFSVLLFIGNILNYIFNENKILGHNQMVDLLNRSLPDKSRLKLFGHCQNTKDAILRYIPFFESPQTVFEFDYKKESTIINFLMIYEKIINRCIDQNSHIGDNELIKIIQKIYTQDKEWLRSIIIVLHRVFDETRLLENPYLSSMLKTLYNQESNIIDVETVDIIGHIENLMGNLVERPTLLEDCNKIVTIINKKISKLKRKNSKLDIEYTHKKVESIIQNTLDVSECTYQLKRIIDVIEQEMNFELALFYFFQSYKEFNLEYFIEMINNQGTLYSTFDLYYVDSLGELTNDLDRLSNIYPSIRQLVKRFKLDNQKGQSIKRHIIDSIIDEIIEDSRKTSEDSKDSDAYMESVINNIDIITKHLNIASSNLSLVIEYAMSHRTIKLLSEYFVALSVVEYSKEQNSRLNHPLMQSKLLEYYRKLKAFSTGDSRSRIKSYINVVLKEAKAWYDPSNIIWQKDGFNE